MKSFFPYKRTAAFLLAALLLLAPAAALAEVKLSAAASKTSVQAGDTVEVTVTVSGKGMSVAEGLFTYDPAVLSYTESSGGASDGFLSMASAQKNGADTLTARIKFTAVAAGTAEVKFNVEKVLGYDGKEQGSADASVSITVAAAPATPTPPPIDYATEGVLAKNAEGAAESMYIWRTLENVTLPANYTETEFTYNDQKVAAATVADSDAPMLFYLSNASGSVGGYYIFDAAVDTFYPYQTISSVSRTYIILKPDGSVALPEGFAETTLTIEEKDYTAWKTQDAQGDIYLLYARNSDGEVGYFVYNSTDKSLQRYAVMPARPAQPTLPPVTTPQPVELTPAPQQSTVPGPAKEGTINVNATLFYAVCGVAALLVIGFAAVVVIRAAEEKRRKKRAAQRRAERDRARKQEIGQ
ncbi:MAG TPA: cohesin domain-containing protein [Clostridia bacterium]|nr:cohesin domain-containing protein [Clostridia bacterium]